MAYQASDGEVPVIHLHLLATCSGTSQHCPVSPWALPDGRRQTEWSHKERRRRGKSAEIEHATRGRLLEPLRLLLMIIEASYSACSRYVGFGW